MRALVPVVQTHFISVEIALHTDHESTEWIKWFEELDNYVVTNPGTDSKWYIYFAPLPSDDADATISDLCTEILRLPDDVKQYLTKAARREFFVGYHAGFQWPAFNDQFSLSTLKLVVELQAEIRLAIYPASSE